MVTLIVKPLEWTENFYGDARSWIANSKEGRFCYGIDFAGKAYWQTPDGEFEADSLDAAKAAAQADYDRRILSALAVSPDAINAMVVATAWQPIETAPKDGTWFLGWESRRAVEDTIRVWRWDRKAGEHGCGMWIDAADSCDFDEQPTHWMPLPSPPALGEQEGRS